MRKERNVLLLSALGFHSGNVTSYNGMIRSFRVSCDMKEERCT